MSFDINIISTGSKGNCVVIDNHLVIDCGLTAKKLMPLIEDDVESIIITHRHGDHLGMTFIRALEKKRPWLMKNIFINQETKGFIKSKFTDKWSFDLDECHVITQNETFTIETSTNKYTITSFKLYHDVENYGFVIINENGEKLIYATDTSSLSDAPIDDYDVIMVEGNYDEDKLLESLITGDSTAQYRATRNLRHLSTQNFDDFVRKCSKPSTITYQLHESGEYGISSNLAINNKKD